MWALFINFRMKQIDGPDDGIDFQTDYIADVCQESGYGYNLDASAVYHSWIKYKMEDITTYRSQSYTNIFTGKKSPVPRTPFMQEFDDSMEHFLNAAE